MNVLELKKGDKVFILKHRLDGFTEALYETSAEVFSMGYNNGQIIVRLVVEDCHSNFRSKCVFNELADEIYPTKEDAYLARPCEWKPNEHIRVADYLGERLKCRIDVTKCAIIAYRWNDALRRAEETPIYFYSGQIDILNYELPDGLYPTKEDCEKANKKMVTIEVTRKFMTEREEGEDAEWLLNHPDEYEWQDGDECVSDAQYAD